MSNGLDPEKDGQNIGSDLLQGSNCLQRLSALMTKVIIRLARNELKDIISWYKKGLYHAYVVLKMSLITCEILINPN